MEAAVEAPRSLWRTVRESHLVVFLLTSVWLMVCFQYFIPQLLLCPLMLIPGVGKQWFRRLLDIYDRHGRVSCMAIPFSWCMCPIHVKNYDSFLAQKAKGDSLLLSTHCSRIDWLIGMYLGTLQPAERRIGFVAEMTIGLMPIIGWSRVLLGDILITRAFHKDGPNIVGNIRSYQKSGIKRLIFLAPEGFIADPKTTVGDKYIAECEQFMQAAGREPLTHLLTPRYKGMQHFAKQAPDNVGSCAMVFVEGHASVDPTSGVVVGGHLATRGLRDAQRTIPDLHSVFKGGLGTFITTTPISVDISEESVASGRLRDQLLTDQARKDAELRHFEAHRTFPGAGAAWDVVPTPHLRMNAYLLAQTVATVWLWSALGGITVQQVLTRIGYMTLFIFVCHASSHLSVRWSLGVSSKESLVGETAIKGLLDLFVLLGKVWPFKILFSIFFGRRAKKA